MNLYYYISSHSILMTKKCYCPAFTQSRRPMYNKVPDWFAPFSVPYPSKLWISFNVDGKVSFLSYFKKYSPQKHVEIFELSSCSSTIYVRINFILKFHFSKRLSLEQFLPVLYFIDWVRKAYHSVQVIACTFKND